MAYTETIELTQNDTLPTIRFFLRDSAEPVGTYLDKRDPETWKPFDITHKKAYVAIREIGTDVVLSTHELIPIDSASGEVALVLPCDPKAFPNAGNFEGEVRIVNDFDCGELTLIDKLRFKIIEEF